MNQEKDITLGEVVRRYCALYDQFFSREILSRKCLSRKSVHDPFP